MEIEDILLNASKHTLNITYQGKPVILETILDNQIDDEAWVEITFRDKVEGIEEDPDNPYIESGVIREYLLDRIEGKDGVSVYWLESDTLHAANLSESLELKLI